MKELSIEEKARAYDEALERAKKYHQQLLNEDNPEWASEIEELFPELKESEDERIMKRIIKLIKMSSEVGGFALHKWEADEMLAWLEKQGHTDSIIEKAKTEKQRVIITETDGNANIDWDTRSLEDARRLLECGLQYINTELEKQGEQKPIWSKKDASYIKDLINYFSQNEKLENTKEDVIAWLKSIKNRYTWKPSDEQMEALKNAIHIKPFENPSDSILWGLYEQLKKLKG